MRTGSAELCCIQGGLPMAYPTDEQIRIRAYELWEQAGKPAGREEDFWHLAERDLQHHADQDGPERIVDSETTVLPGISL